MYGHLYDHDEVHLLEMYDHPYDTSCALRPPLRPLFIRPFYNHWCLTNLWPFQISRWAKSTTKSWPLSYNHIISTLFYSMAVANYIWSTHVKQSIYYFISSSIRIAFIPTLIFYHCLFTKMICYQKRRWTLMAHKYEEHIIFSNCQRWKIYLLINHIRNNYSSGISYHHVELHWDPPFFSPIGVTYVAIIQSNR